MRRFAWFALFLGCWLAVPQPAGAENPVCPEIKVFVVRGSGEAPQGKESSSFSATWDAFDPATADGGSSIDRDVPGDEAGSRNAILYDLVQKVHQRIGGQRRLSWNPVPYPAVPVPLDRLVKAFTQAYPDGLTSFANTSSSVVNAGLWLADGYARSVRDGIKALDRAVKSTWDLCGADTRYVFAGYSQGADVINWYLRGQVPKVIHFDLTKPDWLLPGVGPSDQVRQQIAAVALLGDPNHAPRERSSLTRLDGSLNRHVGLNGLLLARALDIPQLTERTDSVCLAKDPVCGPAAGFDTAVHGKYASADHPVACKVGGLTVREAATDCLADRIVERLGIPNLVRHPIEGPGAAAAARDVAFFIDTTGSMGDDIDAAIEFARNEAARSLGSNGRVALVEYRDAGDDVPARIVTPFTSDLETFLSGLGELYPEGGGDTPEGVLHALMVGFDGLEWRYGAAKAAVVLTDAGFHDPDETGGETLAQVTRRSLEIDPVNVFPVADDDLDSYRALAAATSGEAFEKGDDASVSLAAALERIANRPVAWLSNGTYVAPPSGTVRFDASGSAAVDGEIVSYQWDVDGDGKVDETTTTAVLAHTYEVGFSGFMQVWVTDEAGRTANASAAVQVATEPVVEAPAVPVAAASSASASAELVGRGEGAHVALEVAWEAEESPDSWLVTVDGAPVDIVPGSERSLTADVLPQPDTWQVEVTGLDDAFEESEPVTVRLDGLGSPVDWWSRPGGWGAAAAVAAIVVSGSALLRHLRRRS